jgi:S-adenosylmethionine:tRNA ribosyltransferase-isomerase
MKLEDFNYTLPKEFIAQYPSAQRGESRLLILERKTGAIAHRHFSDIISYFSPGDALCINNTKVIPARLVGKKERTGGKVEVFLLGRLNGSLWSALLRSSGKIKKDQDILFTDGVSCQVQEQNSNGKWTIAFQPKDLTSDEIFALGHVPLPPYIRRDDEEMDRERYQTVYAMHEGSVAAPTAGLHFTESLLSEIETKGVKVVKILLHLGLGTFRPVKQEEIALHRMESEYFEIREESAEALNGTRAAGGKVFVVGTSTTRALETMTSTGTLEPGKGWTEKFIYPPYEFKVVDHLITNFHLPRTTLLMLVSAFASREMILAAYEEAKERGYRFFSYGDAMLIL